MNYASTRYSSDIIWNFGKIYLQWSFNFGVYIVINSTKLKLYTIWSFIEMKKKKIITLYRRPLKIKILKKKIVRKQYTLSPPSCAASCLELQYCYKVEYVLLAKQTWASAWTGPMIETGAQNWIVAMINYRHPERTHASRTFTNLNASVD